MTLADMQNAMDMESLRQRHLDDVRRALPEHLERLAWPAERIRIERRSRLRALVRVAKQRSPWHGRRLAHLDPDRLEEPDLLTVPPMTKHDLMTNFDEILTDPRLRLRQIESHLASLEGEAYLLECYHAVASSGSSGQRGVFVHDWDAWTTYYLACFRHLLRQRLRAGSTAAGPVHMAAVAAGKPTHMSAATFRTFSDPSRLVVHRFPVTLPVAQIIAGLTEVRPAILSGYPSALHELALEALTGALRIAPEQIVVYGEPLLPEHRRRMEEVWGVPVHNWWGTSEANVLGASCGEGPGIHLHDDLHVIEPVGVDGRPTRTGERSTGILLTNLRNHVLPLIRYEMDDEVTPLDGPCPCGSSSRRISDVHGRADEAFRYPDGTFVHPHVFRSALAAESGVLEYQVIQTPDGAEVRLRCEGQVEVTRLRDSLTEALRRCGLNRPHLRISRVERLVRGRTGKLPRFVALSAVSPTEAPMQ